MMRSHRVLTAGQQKSPTGAQDLRGLWTAGQDDQGAVHWLHGREGAGREGWLTAEKEQAGRLAHGRGGIQGKGTAEGH